MANEITVNTSIAITNGSYVLPKMGAANVQATQAVPGGGGPGTISVSTGGVNPSITNLTDQGWVYLKNLDDTNFVDFGAYVTATFHPIGRLLPGETALFRLNPDAVLRLQADTAACKVQVNIFEA